MVQSEAARQMVRAVIGGALAYNCDQQSKLHIEILTGGLLMRRGPSFHPLSEQLVWDYLNDLQSKQAAPSTGASLLSAFRYSKYVFGFSTLDKHFVEQPNQGTD